MSLPIVKPLETITCLLPEEYWKKVEAVIIMEDHLKHIQFLIHIGNYKNIMNSTKAIDKKNLKGLIHYSKVQAMV